MTTFELVTFKAPNPVLGHARPFQEDMLAYVREIAQQGDFVRMRVVNFWIYFLNHPELIHELLIKKEKYFKRPEIVRNAFRGLSTENIFMSSGEMWQRHRKLMQPAFHSRRIQAYADTMVDYTLREIDKWQDGAPVDADASMTEIAMYVIVKTMFGMELDVDAGETGHLMMELFDIGGDRAKRGYMIPMFVPTEENRRVRAYSQQLTETFSKVIADWRQHGEDRGDLLSTLMLARYEDGSAMSDEQLLSELFTIFGAGHETTAKTLAFAWYAISQHPDVQARLHEEVDTVLQGRRPTLDDLGKLTYTEQVIRETMRLYSAANAVTRQALEDVELGGHILKKGDNVFVSQWILHYDARWFPNPGQFDPERFTPENESNIPKYAYIPFGLGPRVCIGNQFSLMESKLVLATVAQQYALEMQPGATVRPVSRFTVGTENGMPMIARARQPIKV